MKKHKTDWNLCLGNDQQKLQWPVGRLSSKTALKGKAKTSTTSKANHGTE